MTTEVLERLKSAIDAAAELVELLEPQLELPLWDDNISVDANIDRAWRHFHGHQVRVNLFNSDLLARSVRLDVRIIGRERGPYVSGVFVPSRLADGTGAKPGYVALGRLVLLRAGLWINLPGMEVNHLDNNPLNCALENLECVTHKENMEHRSLMNQKAKAAQQLELQLEPAA